MKKDIIIAIDPDVDGSGVAVLAPQTKTLLLRNLTLPMLVDFFNVATTSYKKENLSYVVVVEASYLIPANWHLSWNDSKNRAAAKGKLVGRNHEVGRQIVEFCKHLDIPYEEKLPLTKCWAGKDGKITQQELDMLLDAMGFPPIAGRTNQEKRDAALLALDRSGLPFIMGEQKINRKK